MGATADLRQLDRVLASVPTRQSVWPDNGSQRLGRIIGQFDPDALLKPVFDYTPRAQNVVPFDLLNSVSVTHRLSVAICLEGQRAGLDFPNRSPARLLALHEKRPPFVVSEGQVSLRNADTHLTP